MDLGVYILRVYIYIHTSNIYIYMYIDISLRDVHQQKLGISHKQTHGPQRLQRRVIIYPYRQAK